jgi:hypothetical protein
MQPPNLDAVACKRLGIRDVFTAQNLFYPKRQEWKY